MDLLAELPLGADTAQIADEQYAQYQLGVYRWPSSGTVVSGESLADETEVERGVNAAEQMISGHVVIETETKEQRLLSRQPAHDRRVFPSSGHPRRNTQSTGSQASFSTVSPDLRTLFAGLHEAHFYAVTPSSFPAERNARPVCRFYDVNPHEVLRTIRIVHFNRRQHVFVLHD